MTKVYVAASHVERRAAVALRDLLRQEGVECTSRWLDAPVSQKSHESCEEDVADVRSADAVVFLHAPLYAPSTTGGRHVEFGLALGLGKRIVIVGRRENVFHYDESVVVVRTPFEAVAAVLRREVERD